MTDARRRFAGTIDQLLQAARAANGAGRRDEAETHLRSVLARAPDHPMANNMLGMIALADGRHADAERAFVRATRGDTAAPELHLNVANARRLQGDDEGERAALEAALAIDQRHFMSLLRLAELHQRHDRHDDATRMWTGVVTLIAAADPPLPELAEIDARGRAYLAERQAQFAAGLERRLGTARDTVAPGARRRFDAAMDVAFGRRRIYANECEGLFYPFLPADEYFDRAHFPWLADLEAQTDVIRAEAQALLAGGDVGLSPYVEMPSGTPTNKWTPLDHSLDWGALHLWRHGIRDEAACARAPRTAEIVSQLPLADIPGRTPTVFFSILKPRTHLPAHAGVSNVRSTVHLPLIVPEGCRFRVGGETRDWREGAAWVFDDTIEHEAWNDSDQPRAILIFDVWNPYLSEDECGLLRAFFATAAEAGMVTAVSD